MKDVELDFCSIGQKGDIGAIWKTSKHMDPGNPPFRLEMVCIRRTRHNEATGRAFAYRTSKAAAHEPCGAICTRRSWQEAGRHPHPAFLRRRQAGRLGQAQRAQRDGLRHPRQLFLLRICRTFRASAGQYIILLLINPRIYSNTYKTFQLQSGNEKKSPGRTAQ